MILEQHVTALRDERRRVQAEADRVKASLNELEEQLQRIDTALAALTGTDRSKPRRSGKGVSTKEVVAEMQVALRAGKLTEGELATRVAESLKAKGKPRTGLALRFKQALKRECFVREGEVVALAAESQA